MSRVFLSHSSRDSRQAIAVKAWLVDQEPGLAEEIFLDLDPHTGIRPGERWKQALNQANSRCEAVICLLSEHWNRSHECAAEYRHAESLHKTILCARLEPVPDTGITSEWQRCDLFGGDGPTTAITVDEGEPVVLCTEGLQRLLEGLRALGIGVEHFPWPPPGDPDRAPYRGWAPLEEADAAVFFGRDAQILGGLDVLNGMRTSGVKSLFVVLGPSGAGKSSFLRAGLLPRLRRDDRRFLPLPIVRPERAVLTGELGLAAAIYRLRTGLGLPAPLLGEIKTACLGSDVEALRGWLEHARQVARIRLLDVPAEQPAPTLMLPVDQAEELFNADAGPEAPQFLQILAALVEHEAGVTPGLIVAATIRADRYEPLQIAPELAEVHSVVFDELKPLPPGGYKDVIIGPGRRAAGRRLRVEPALVERLLTETSESADALPLLALTLERLYHDFGADGELTVAEYQSMGGMAQIVQTEVDKLLAADPEERQAQLDILHDAFIPWLARINPDNDQPMRRLARWDDLPAAGHPLIQAMVEKRLLVKDTRNGQTVVEVALESLLRQWRELAAWLRDEAHDLKDADALERAAVDWQASDRNESWLLEGIRLAEAETLAAKPGFHDRLDPTRDFLQASRRRAALRKRSRILIAVLALTVVVALVAAMLAAVAWNRATAASRHANGMRLIADAEGMLAGTRPGGDTRGLQELLAAPGLMKSSDDNSLFSALYSAVLTKADISHIINNPMPAGQVIAVRSVSVSPDGKWIASGSDDQTVRLWDAETGKLHTELAVGAGGGTPTDRMPMLTVAFSPDGNWIATGSGDQLQVWDASSGKKIGGPMALAGTAHDVDFSPDGQRIVTGSDGGAVQVWDRATGAEEASLAGHDPNMSVRSVAFSREGDLIASGGDDGTVRLWDVHTRARIHTSDTTASSVTRLAFSPSGEPRLVVGRSDGTVEILDGRNLAVKGSFTAHRNAVNSVAFSPDGSRVVTGGADNTVRVWDATTREPTLIGHPLRGHHGEVTSVVFNPNGTRVVSGSVDGSVREWDVIGGLPLPTAQGKISAIAFSRDGRQIASAGSDGTIKLWNPDTAKPVGQLGDPASNPPAVNSLAFNPGGSQIVAGAQDGSVRMWDLNTRRGTELEVPRTRPHTAPPAKSRRITSVAFSRDASLIVSGGADGAVRLWDAHTLKPVGAMFAPYQVWSVAISPDGRTVASASGEKDSSIQLWDVATHTADGPPMVGQPGWSIHSIDFSPDGQRIVSGSHDGIIQVWSVDSRQPLAPRPMSVDANPVLSVAFAHDHPWIVSGYADGAVRVWDAASYQPIGAPLVGSEDAVPSVAISEDDTLILSGSYDGNIQLWPTPKDLTGRLCDKLSANMSRQQWNDWVSSTDDYVLTCPRLPTPPGE